MEKATEQRRSKRRFSLGSVQDSSHTTAASGMHAPSNWQCRLGVIIDLSGHKTAGTVPLPI